MGTARLHVARAGARPARRPPLRHLLLRRGALRDALGPARVPRRLRRRDDERDPQGGPARALRHEPEHLPPGLERIVRHCLEKSPEGRFQSARDIAFDLEALSETPSPAAGPRSTAVSTPRRALAAAVAALAAGLAIGAWLHRVFLSSLDTYGHETDVSAWMDERRSLRSGRSDGRLQRHVERRTVRNLDNTHW